MSDYGITAAHAVSIASSTFAFGFIFGWIWALLHFGGSSNHSNTSGVQATGITDNSNRVSLS